MKPDTIVIALKKDREIELSVKGRKSGKNLPRPVWFVLKEKELLLLPVTGTDSQWYKNILREITEKGEVEEVIELFRAKYGASDVKRYYPKPNVAASLLLE